MSALIRPHLNDLSSRDFDVVVTGAGIFGACFAYELAGRGMRVLLVEKNDFGAGASANSLRIVHGGLRYLQTLNFRRARQSAMERSVLLRIFPGLITPLLCVVPTGPGFKTGRSAFAGGLAVNELITFDRNFGLPCEQRLPRGGLESVRWLSNRCPHLDLSGNTGVAYWYDAFMEDPDRLLLNYVKAAVSHGATVINHASTDAYFSSNGCLSGVGITDQLLGNSVEVAVKLAIDCRSGWFADGASFCASFRQKNSIQYARGVNLVVDRKLCDCAVGFRSERNAKGGRFLFMVPHAEKTIVGTWYLPLMGPPASASTTEDERVSMFEEVASAMPTAQLRLKDLVAQHVGILPCTAQTKPGEAELVPVETPYLESGKRVGAPDGVWLVQGEKWTTARKTAETMSRVIASVSGISLGPSLSSSTALSASAYTLPDSLGGEGASAAQAAQARFVRRRGADMEKLKSLVSTNNYGSEIPLLEAETRLAIENEMAMSLGDVVRRLGLGQLECPDTETLLMIAKAAQNCFGWSRSEMFRQIDAVEMDARFFSRANGRGVSNQNIS
jgi:glycerol-3-phosphate dehydrogenase